MIIGLVTVNWVKIPNLVEYIAFAATLVSIVLGLLAIIYAFFSNSTFSMNISALSSIAQQISNNSNTLKEAVLAVQHHAEEIPHN